MSKVKEVKEVKRTTGEETLEYFKSQKFLYFRDEDKENLILTISRLKEALPKLKTKIVESEKFWSSLSTATGLILHLGIKSPEVAENALEDFSTAFLTLSAYLIYIEELEALVK